MPPFWAQMANRPRKDSMKLITWIKGKKTYALALIGLVYAVSGYFTGHIDGSTALELGWGALTASAIRHGVNK